VVSRNRDNSITVAGMSYAACLWLCGNWAVSSYQHPA